MQNNFLQCPCGGFLPVDTIRTSIKCSCRRSGAMQHAWSMHQGYWWNSWSMNFCNPLEGPICLCLLWEQKHSRGLLPLRKIFCDFLPSPTLWSWECEDLYCRVCCLPSPQSWAQEVPKEPHVPPTFDTNWAATYLDLLRLASAAAACRSWVDLLAGTPKTALWVTSLRILLCPARCVLGEDGGVREPSFCPWTAVGGVVWGFCCCLICACI